MAITGHDALLGRRPNPAVRKVGDSRRNILGLGNPGKVSEAKRQIAFGWKQPIGK
jgi:hypothetical protein